LCCAPSIRFAVLYLIVSIRLRVAETKRLRPLDAALPLPHSEVNAPRSGDMREMPMATASAERTRLTRRNVLRCVLVAPAVVAGARRASAAEPVSVGMVNTISDAGFFVAEAKGYFKAAGIDVKFSPFPSASGMIAPLASGDST
jgi:NMT1/THI5 like